MSAEGPMCTRMLLARRNTFQRSGPSASTKGERPCYLHIARQRQQPQRTAAEGINLHGIAFNGVNAEHVKT
eukprot:6616925-Alexandrium_andersonii.AAC.1